MNEEIVPVPMHCEAVKAVETLQQFLQSVSDVPESVMKSVWEIDAFIIGLARKRTKQMTLDSYQETVYRFLKVMTISIHLCC
jgi:hypothetical protein